MPVTDNPAVADVVDAQLGSLPHSVRASVAEVVALDARDRVAMSRSDRVADVITAFTGSMLFVALHAVWFTAWIVLNLPGMPAFDPFPFGLLTMIVSLEAIFLSTFVLISQNRQALRADRRATVDLELNAIAEQEVTKLIHMVSEIHDALGLAHSHDEELRQMKKPTYVRDLANVVDEAERAANGNGEERPRSAADTES